MATTLESGAWSGLLAIYYYYTHSQHCSTCASTLPFWRILPAVPIAKLVWILQSNWIELPALSTMIRRTTADCRLCTGALKMTRSILCHRQTSNIQSQKCAARIE